MLQNLLLLDLKPLLLPALVALAILGLEPLLLSLRLFILLPGDSGIPLRGLRTLYFKAQLISHFSISAVGDLFRLKKLGSLAGAKELPVLDRVQYLAVERISESVTLPLIGFLFTDLATIRKMIPVPSPLPLVCMIAVIAAALLIRKKKSGAPAALSKTGVRSLLMVFLLSAIGWSMDLLALRALTWHEGIPLAELMIALIGLSLSSLPPLPWGRWGLFEGILGASLHQSGVPLERALALAAVFHILMVIPFAAVSLYSWFGSRLARTPDRHRR